MIIDTHAHCYWDNLEAKIDLIVENMQQAQVSHAIQIWCDIETSLKAIDLARRFPGIFYATVGYHPETAQDMKFNLQEVERFEKLILDHRDVIVALWETGLDYHYLNLGNEWIQKKNQEEWWLMQWELAQKYNLPLVIHTRDARDATLDFIVEHDIYRAVIHCYSEDPGFAQNWWIFLRRYILLLVEFLHTKSLNWFKRQQKYFHLIEYYLRQTHHFYLLKWYVEQ